MNEANASDVDAGRRIANAGMGTGSQRSEFSDGGPTKAPTGADEVIRGVEEKESDGGCGEVGEPAEAGWSEEDTSGEGAPEAARYGVPRTRRGTSFHRLMADELETAVKT